MEDCELLEELRSTTRFIAEAAIADDPKSVRDLRILTIDAEGTIFGFSIVRNFHIRFRHGVCISRSRVIEGSQLEKCFRMAIGNHGVQQQ